MDEFVENTLKRWNLVDLVERFRDEEVNEEAFLLLTPDIIKELIPKLGKRAIFNARITELKKLLELQRSREDRGSYSNESPRVTLSLNPPQSSSRVSMDLESNTPTSEPSLFKINNIRSYVDEAGKRQDNEKEFEKYFLQQLTTPTEAPSSAQVPDTADDDNSTIEVDNDDEPLVKRIKLEKLEGEELDDDTFLEESQDSCGVYENTHDSTQIEDDEMIAAGAEQLRSLLGESPLTKDMATVTELDKIQRTHLTNALVHYMITTSPNGKVSNKTFLYWAKAIGSLFPAEKVRTYYRSRENEGSNGKLQERYGYLLRTKKSEINKLREQHVYAINKAGEGSSHQSDDSCEPSDAQDSDHQPLVNPTDGQKLGSANPGEQLAVDQLKQIIGSCFMMRDTLKAKFLTPNQRNILAANIVNYLMDKNGGPISLDEMECYAKAIEKFFPHENASIYLRRANNRARAHGKLFDRYGYMKRKKSLARGKAYNDFLDQRSPIGQLRQLPTVEEARFLWNETHKARKEVTRKFVPIKFYEMFPFLTKSDGYLLFLEDFNRDFPDAVDTFERHWPEYATSIFRYISDNDFLKGVTEFCTIDYQNDILTSSLIILPLLFKLSKRSERHWSPTRLDVSHNFVMYAREFREAIDQLKRRQELFERFKLRLNPVVVAIGPTISTIDSSYVVINHVFYKFGCVQEAVEVCIKIYAAIGIRYLDEAASPWMFLQRFVMKLELPTDNITTKVFTVLEALDKPFR